MRASDRGLRASLLVACSFLCLSLPTAPVGAAGQFRIGTPATDEQIAGWNIDIAPDGSGLPDGEGSVAAGRELYAARCLSCHGERGEGGMGGRLAGGEGSLGTDDPVKTVGSYWQHATTLYDYIRRAMPMDAPQSLSSDEVYAATAYLLSLNGLLPEDATLDAERLVRVRMPNQDGFVRDPRPDVQSRSCMEGCPPDP